MDRRLTSAIFVFCVFVLLPGAALAQLQDNLEVNVFGGGSVYSDKKFEIGFPQSTLPVQETFKLNKAIRGGLRVGVYTRGHWSEEFFYSYEPSTAHFIRRSPPTNSVNLRLGINNYGATGLYYLREDESYSIRPFLSIGVGGTLYRLTDQAESFARDPLRGNIPGITNADALPTKSGFAVPVRSSVGLGVWGDVRCLLGGAPSF